MKNIIVTIIGIVFTTIAFQGTAAVDAAKAKKLAQSKNCLACHAVDKKLVGPSYKDVAKKYKGTDGAVDYLVEKVLKGGSGNWGSIPMPPNMIDKGDAKTLVEWILSK